jgi:hypothetical protein
MKLIRRFPIFSKSAKKVNALLRNLLNFDFRNPDHIALGLELLFGMAVEVLLNIGVEDGGGGVVGEEQVRLVGGVQGEKGFMLQVETEQFAQLMVLVRNLGVGNGIRKWERDWEK